jgi:hypothetical protein
MTSKWAFNSNSSILIPLSSKRIEIELFSLNADMFPKFLKLSTFDFKETFLPNLIVVSIMLG